MLIKKARGRAPARLDIMGGIADYSGSMVLEMPLDIYTTVTVQTRKDLKVRIKSAELNTEFTFKNILPLRGQIVEKRPWENFDLPQWSLYVYGCIFVLLDEFPIPFTGLDIYIKSEIPFGRGLSSSAALEVATLRALKQYYKLEIEGQQLAILAQRAENYVADAPCGIMDQMTVHLGKQGHLLPIICQPHEILPQIPVPSGLFFSGLDTGVKHEVSGVNYGKVRTATFMGLQIIRQELQIAYLCELTVADYENRFLHLLPERMSGAEFLETFGTLQDPLSSLNPGEMYEIRACCSFPIYENQRVRTIRTALSSGKIDNEELGTLMYASHQGYKSIGLSCDEANFIVELALRMGNSEGIYGARITGGGAGGTVALLTKDLDCAKVIQQLYFENFGYRSMLKLTGHGN